MSNLKFLTIRKCYGFEWESFENHKRGYVAICHRVSASVEADTWEQLWDKILMKSKSIRKKQRKGRK